MSINSTVSVKTPNLSLTITIGVLLTAAIVIIAAMFSFEFGIILLVVAGSIGATGATIAVTRIVALIQANRLSNLEYDIRKQDLRSATYTANRLELESTVLHFPSGHRLVSMAGSGLQISDVPQSQALQLAAQSEPAQLTFLDVIRKESCVMIYGGRGSGKTSAAQHWLKTRSGDCVVIDPKKGLNHWPNSRVINEMSEMGHAIGAVEAEMMRRREEGDTSSPHLTLFLDELYILVNVHKMDVMTSVFAIITLGREYNVHAGFTASATGVKSFGIEGQSGLMEALTSVHLTLSAGVYGCEVDAGNGSIICDHPGRFLDRPTQPAQSVELPLTEEDKIKKLINEGLKTGAICKRMSWPNGGSKYKKINDIRERISQEMENTNDEK